MKQLVKEVFSKEEQKVVREAVLRLPIDEKLIVLLRFWENNSIQDIAETLEMPWDEVERSLKKSLKKLKELCTADPNFGENKQKLAA